MRVQQQCVPRWLSRRSALGMAPGKAAVQQFPPQIQCPAPSTASHPKPAPSLMPKPRASPPLHPAALLDFIKPFIVQTRFILQDKKSMLSAEPWGILRERSDFICSCSAVVNTPIPLLTVSWVAGRTVPSLYFFLIHLYLKKPDPCDGKK